MHRTVIAVWAVALALVGVAPGHAEKRVALVVGNDLYDNLPADQQLRRAANDARAVGDALDRLGFEVLRGENFGRQALVEKFDELTRRLSPGDTTFFFFAGHGVSIRGGNYILPTDVPNVQPGQEALLARTSLGENDIVSDCRGAVCGLRWWSWMHAATIRSSGLTRERSAGSAAACAAIRCRG